jgi:hypothetical protein
MVRARMWTADKRMPLGVPRVGEVLKGGRMKNRTEKENPQHKRSLPQCSLMDSFKSYLFRQAYKDVEKLGDRLAEVEPLINWEKFRPILQALFDNQGPQGGRPNVDPVLMVKMLTLNAVSFLTVREYQPFSGIDLPLSLVQINLTGQLSGLA